MTNTEGCPVAVEVFEGNTADPATVEKQISKLRQRFGLEQMILVGDRGTLTSARIRENLQTAEQIRWITALRARQIAKLVASEALQLSLFDERELAGIEHPDYPGERLIACRNPLLAVERTRNRNELLQATEERLNKVVTATQREKRALRGKDRIALAAGKALGRYKMSKHFQLNITDDSFSFERKQDSIEAEAALDAIYVIRTNVPAAAMSASQAVATYKGLSAVEQAFRSLKSVDLKIRPIHHRLADRVKAHVLLCMLAWYLEWHLRKQLAPVLFDDSDPAAGKALRGSVVAAAQRSPEAQAKARRKKTEHGLPVHSFRTLLQDLQTSVRNRVRLNDTTFEVLTIPTTFQQHVFLLLGFSPQL